MFIKTIKIKGYRVFDGEFTASLNKGLNVIVGENASGKSTVVDAIRLLLLEDEYGRGGINSKDFHRPIIDPARSLGRGYIGIRCEFSELGDDEQVAYLPWLDINNPTTAILNLAIENREDSRGRFKRKIWGNESETGLFEWELLNRIHCVYLPALRDAEEKLKAFKGSRIAKLLKNLKDPVPVGEHPLEKKITALNKELLKEESIKKANQFIRDNVIKSVGEVFGQDISLQFSEVNFDRIVERIRLLFYPELPQNGRPTDLNMFRSLSENSLGFNNILYLATILAEFDGLSTGNSFHKVLLIEEPEAHLHPQLQIRLMQYLEEKSRENDIQVIVTTHSPTLASGVDLNCIKVLTLISSDRNPVFTALSNCQIGDSRDFIQRWLDITKSVLLFAKGVLLVEGIAEALVVKELSKTVLNRLATDNPNEKFHNDLNDYGISIVNMNGIYFEHFFRLFKGYYKSGEDFLECEGIPIKCAGLTDNDPVKESKPTHLNPAIGRNSALYLVQELTQYSPKCRLFSNLKTFEYDLAIEGNNLAHMSAVFLELVATDGPVRATATEYSTTDWLMKSDQDKADAAFWLLNQIDGKKGEFAQLLAKNVATNNSFAVPKYITDAIVWIIQ